MKKNHKISNTIKYLASLILLMVPLPGGNMGSGSGSRETEEHQRLEENRQSMRNVVSHVIAVVRRQGNRAPEALNETHDEIQPQVPQVQVPQQLPQEAPQRAPRQARQAASTEKDSLEELLLKSEKREHGFPSRSSLRSRYQAGPSNGPQEMEELVRSSEMRQTEAETLMDIEEADTSTPNTDSQPDHQAIPGGSRHRDKRRKKNMMN